MKNERNGTGKQPEDGEQRTKTEYGSTTQNTEKAKGVYDHITHDDVLRNFNYDPHTGEVRRKLTIGKWKAGTRCGYENTHIGYRYVNFKGKMIPEHRLVWFILTERWPDEVDHINGDRKDNRLSNLRECSRKQNCMNRGPVSGRFKGVTWVKKTGKWKAQLRHNDKNINIGDYSCVEDAAKAYDVACFILKGIDFPVFNFGIPDQDCIQDCIGNAAVYKYLLDEARRKYDGDD